MKGIFYHMLCICHVCVYMYMYIQVGKLIGQKWRELSDDDKQPYFEEYEAEKAVYVEQLKRYKNSPAYKKWMEAKAQGMLLPVVLHTHLLL